MFSTLQREAVWYRSKHDNLDGDDVTYGEDGESDLNMRLVSFIFSLCHR